MTFIVRTFQTLSPIKRLPAPADLTGGGKNPGAHSSAAVLDASQQAGEAVVSMQEISLSDGGGAKKKKKAPRRVIHCSDGVVEEYSTDEEELEEIRKQEEEKKRKRALIDPKALAWVPWMVHYTWIFGESIVG